MGRPKSQAKRVANTVLTAARYNTSPTSSTSPSPPPSVPPVDDAPSTPPSVPPVDNAPVNENENREDSEDSKEELDDAPANENENREDSEDSEEELGSQDSQSVESKESREVSPELSSSTERGSFEANEIRRGVMPPVGFYINKDQYPRTVKIATRCYIAKAVSEIEKRLDKQEMEWFLNHPQFNHFFHMPRDSNHKSMGMWMLILRMTCIEKKKELWFVVNGVPIRYSMREHVLISGLFCHDYPEKYEEIGDFKFVEKHFKDAEKVTQEMVEAKFFSMRTRTNDRLNMAVLYFLTHVIKGNAKRGNAKRGLEDAPGIDPFLQRIVTKLDKCVSFPWGRFTFFDNLNEIERMVGLFKDGVVNKACNLPSFIVPLEFLAFEAIPMLGSHFRTAVPGANKKCPKMCKVKFKSWSLRGFPIESIYEKLGETMEIDSIIPATRHERHLISDLDEEDDAVDGVVDGWNHRLLVENQPLFFEELCQEDIKMRTKVVAEPAVGKEPAVGEEPGVGETSQAASVGVIGLKDFKEFQEMMVAGFKEMNEKLESVQERLNVVESVVVRGRFQGDFPNVGEHVKEKEKHQGEEEGAGELEKGVSEVEKEKELEDEEGREVEMGEEQATKGQEKVKEEEEEVEKDDAQVGETQVKEPQEKEPEVGDAQENAGLEVREEEAAGKVQEEEEEVEEEEAEKEQDKEPQAEKRKKKKRTHSEVLKPPYERPQTRQRTKE